MGVLGVSILWLEDVEEEEQEEERTSGVSDQGVATYVSFIIMGKIGPMSPNFPAGALPFTNMKFKVALLAWQRCTEGGGAYFVT